jgi:putative transposase
VSDKFELIAAEKADPTSPFKVRPMCAWLGVSTSGFYDWEAAPVSDRARRRAKVVEYVEAAFKLGRGTYGVRRVHHVLSNSDDPEVASASLKLVRSIMTERDLHACQPRAYRTTTVRDEDAHVEIEDHVRRDFTAPAPGTKLVGDITFSAQPVVMCSSAA